MKPINLDVIDTEHLQRIIAVLQKQLERTDKHTPHGQALTDNQNLLQQYQSELERRKTTITDEQA